MSQHPDGGERAHRIVESRLAGNDADAAFEFAKELVPVVEAPDSIARPFDCAHRGVADQNGSLRPG